MMEYESDLDAWRDYTSNMSSSFLSGKLESIKEIAKKGLKRGMSILDIAELTGLNEDEIRNIVV